MHLRSRFLTGVSLTGAAFAAAAVLAPSAGAATATVTPPPATPPASVSGTGTLVCEIPHASSQQLAAITDSRVTTANLCAQPGAIPASQISATTGPSGATSTSDTVPAVAEPDTEVVPDWSFHLYQSSPSGHASFHESNSVGDGAYLISGTLSIIWGNYSHGSPSPSGAIADSYTGPTTSWSDYQDRYTNTGTLLATIVGAAITVDPDGSEYEWKYSGSAGLWIT